MTENRHDAQIRNLVAELAASAPPAPPFRRIAERLVSAPRADQLVARTGVATTDPNGKSSEPAPPYVREQPRRTKPWRLMAALVAFGLAAAGGVFAYGSLSGDDGTATPEKAVEQFVDSFTNSDVAGMLESLAPSERIVLRESLESLNSQASRLSLTKGLDLNHVSGVKLEVSGLRLSATGLSQNVASVDVKGTLRSTANDRELPIGDVARKLLVDSLPKNGYQGVADALQRAINRQDVHLVTLREGGGWHVSVWYTLAEYMRKNVGAAMPNFGHSRITPAGAESPDGALRALIETSGDYMKVVALTTPEESRVLYDYVPGFVAATQRDEIVSDLRIHQLGTRVEGSGDRRTVHIDSYDVSWTYRYASGQHDSTVPGSDPSAARTEFTKYRQTFDGDCYTATSTYVTEPPANPGQPEVDKTCRKDALAGGTTPLQWELRKTMQVTVERHDSRWFVSPVRSLVGETVARLARVPDGQAFTDLAKNEDSFGAFALLPYDVLGLALGSPFNSFGYLQFSGSSSSSESASSSSGPTPTTLIGPPTSAPATTAPRPGG
jgi:hypothetical protein